ncbi:3-hydroxyphenylacetate 6 hydroxylase [Colletotrichum sp. SAR11_57]|nr:3-hydroxyphenylacetate 6 hydroxylase [Colletotrichum sp. SAR11_57]
MNSRPTFYIFHKKVSKAVTSIGTSPWDESCKRRRKAAAGALNRPRVESYAPILNLEAREFLGDIYSESRDGSIAIDFRPAVRRFALNLSLTLNYGTRVSNVTSLKDDPLLAEIIYVESEISKFRDTGKNYANYIPLLRYWEPVANAFGLNSSPKDHATDIGRRRLEYNDVLLDKLRGEVERGDDKPCIQGAVLRDPESATLTRQELISVSLSMMAGADSNQPTLAWAILLLAHRPDIQSKAYEAIKDSGVLQKPSNSYASTKIDYIDALTKEIGRYFVVLKLALPKATYADVTWGSATIPADTLVFLNSWACNRDSDLFAEPDVFAPERWLPDAPDQYAHQFAFGIGGRIVKDLIVVVTGGGTGIGLMIAQGLEANGAIVYIIGRRQEALDKAASTAKHGNIRTIQGDVTSKSDLEKAVSQIKSAHGYVNVVIANSGIGGPALKGMPANPSISQWRDFVWNWDPEEFTKTFAVNATGVFFTVAAFLELLDEGNKRSNFKQRSQVIATSSIGAFNRQPMGFAYGASKSAVVHMMKQLSTVLVPYNIRSNVIAPGFYPSEMTTATVEQHKDGWPKATIPEERAGDAEDMVGAVLYLVSRAGAYTNGNVLISDGGRLAVVPSSY